MEVRINKEIRNYTESIFFGLSLRQFIFSIFACGIAVLLYFLFKDQLGTESISVVCVLGAAPFAVLGFITYNGMSAEQFIWAWIKSEIIMPRRLVFASTNLYYEILKPEQKVWSDNVENGRSSKVSGGGSSEKSVGGRGIEVSSVENIEGRGIGVSSEENVEERGIGVSSEENTERRSTERRSIERSEGISIENRKEGLNSHD